MDAKVVLVICVMIVATSMDDEGLVNDSPVSLLVRS